MKFSLGIRSQLIAGIVIMTTAGIGLIGVLGINIVESSAVYWKVNEAVSTVEFIRAVVLRPETASTRTGSLSLPGKALRVTGAGDFRITEPSGKVLLKGGALPDGRGKLIPTSGDVTVRRVGGGWFKGAGEMLYVTAPLRTGPGGGGGTIAFTVPLGEINEEVASVRRFFLIYAAIDSAIIILFGVFFISRSVLNPLKRLEQAATSIAGGRLDERADVPLENEIGRLAGSFNVMAGRLEAEIKALERVNTELGATQEELLRSSTLASVGSLAAGVAHEIGNPLGAVSGYLDLLGNGISDKDEEKEIIKRTTVEVSRIDAIVREFLELSRPSKKPATPVDVNRLIGEAVSTAAVNEKFAGMEVVTVLGEDLPRVLIDEGRLRQVFINILINAAHSMLNTDSQKLVRVESLVEERTVPGVSVSRRKGDTPFGTEPPPAPMKEYVVVRFIDTGCGISDEDAGKIFDPFYTTKGVGAGTGLGLFVSQGIIKAYGGEIRFDGGAGPGAAFSVMLPTDRTQSAKDT